MPLNPKQQPPYYTPATSGSGIITGLYTALLTQAGTAAPTAIILQNTLGLIPTWTRINAGHYSLTATGLFIANNMTVENQQIGAPNGFTNVDLSLTPNTIVLDTYILVLTIVPDVGIMYSDGILNKSMIRITLYS